MGLTAKEKEMLDNLTKKSKEPDREPVSRSVRASIDLSDPKQVALAIKHGFLDPDDEPDDKDDDKDDKKDKGDDTPKRKGYFGDSD